jgi:uncharacterized repeat protein (TIGR01451 family)
MKKTIGLTLPIGLLIIFLTLYYSNAEASDLYLDKPITIREEISPKQDEPPWYDFAWHYRRPVIITNTGGSLPYYQELVKLDSGNFDFSRAKPDGSDVRLTHSDGTTELRYWVESWDSANQQAFLWVRVPALANGDTTIYLYYNNPDAVSTSSGTTTFDLFDDFLDFTGGSCGLVGGDNAAELFNVPWNIQEWSQFIDHQLSFSGPWCVISGTPTASAGILSLPEGSGIRSLNSFLYKAVGFRANYGLGAGKEWGGFINGASGQQTTIGDYKPLNVDDLYMTDYVNEFEYNLMPRNEGLNWHGTYHVFEIGWRAGQSEANIDHGASSASSSQPSQVPSTNLPVTLYSFMDSNATLLVDWVYVRQYRLPEPTSSVGSEQGLIELEITKEDFPDPLYAGEGLTYLLTISNTSSIDAPGVMVTDTLPTEVIFAEALPSQGNCSPTDGSVLCSLDTIPALSSASITIVVTTTIDGMITNQAYVGSPGYEQDPNNNSDQVTTTVNPSADLAIDAKGYPEVIRTNGILTYVITVTNQGPSEAVDIYMFDSLPIGVTYIDAFPDFCANNGLEVTCSLGELNQAQETQIIITTTVTTKETVNLINTAFTSSSQTHDPSLLNNTFDTSNLADNTVPVVDWVKPVNNGNTYITVGGTIPLEAIANDNDQVAWVEFRLWDHITAKWISIGKDHTSPYQVLFDSSILLLNETYQMFVLGVDRAGNQSNPYDPLQRIFFQRKLPVFLPILSK